MIYLKKKFSDSDGKDMHEVTERQIELLVGEGQKYGCFDFWRPPFFLTLYAFSHELSWSDFFYYGKTWNDKK